MTFNKLNNRLGWGVFAIATLVYFLTLERTVSLWDCGEYISTSYKLEVGHPPGAPLFMMLGRLFSFFVGPESVAFMINLMSGLSSSFSILFLFWTITLIGRKLAHHQNNASNDKHNRDDEALSTGQRWAILGSALIGSLAYTFTDSFWFSAVEAEVYAMSSFFTALVFWAIFKWERIADENKADRWLVFIAFMVGLSIGVHLLNLLAIPALAFIYYFRRFDKSTPIGFIITGVVAIVALLIIQEGIIPGTIKLAANFEIWAVNGQGLPFNFGTILFGILLVGLITGGIIYARKTGRVNLHTALVSLMMLYAGYTCFAMITIRSNANPPIDENNPENLVSLNSYLLREQYGDWPLFYGPYWNSIMESRENYADKNDVYIRAYTVQVTKGDDAEDVKGFSNEADAKAYADKVGGQVVEKYYMSNDRSKSKPTYTSETSTYLPRMYSSDPKHVRQYKAWSGYTTEGKEPIRNPYAAPGSPDEFIYLPSFGENLKYLFNYQIGHMYLRYFFWNFVGRQNDDQNWDGNLLEGNWMSGVGFIDKEHLGSQENLPDHMASNNARNTYFFLPLILGLIGMIFHIVRAPKDWFVVFLLFIFTGLAIVFYLNQKPMEPRERDYAYAGSTYAFAIWIGLGVYALYDMARRLQPKQLGLVIGYAVGLGVIVYFAEVTKGGDHLFSYSLFYMALVGGAMVAIIYGLNKALKDEMKVAMSSTLLCLIVPGVLSVQGWDDHDRSGRYTARELAKNYLRACEPNAILFTNGDNDTFPLWYVQEVEGFRTDVRVVNLSLLNTDWYVDQAARKAYDSDALPISFTQEEYREGNGRDFIALPRLVLGVYYNRANAGLGPDPLLEKAAKKVNQFRDRELDIRDALQFVQSEKGEDNYIFIQSGKRTPSDRTYYFPSNRFYLPVNKEQVIANGVVDESERSAIVDTIRWSTNESGMYRANLMILDMIASSNWERPIYFAATGGDDAYVGLQKYLRLEGMVYRFVPVNTGTSSRYISPGLVDTDKTYDVLMNQFEWGGLNKPGVNLDYYTIRPTVNFRRYYLALADALMSEKDATRAKEVLDGSLVEFPMEMIPLDFNAPYMTETYLAIADQFGSEGKKDEATDARSKAALLANAFMKQQNQMITYLLDKELRFFDDLGIANELSIAYTMLATLSDMTEGEAGELENNAFEAKVSARDQILQKWSECIQLMADETDDEKRIEMRNALLNGEYIELMENFLIDLTNAYVDIRRKHMQLSPDEFTKMFQSSNDASIEMLRDEVEHLRSFRATNLFLNAVLIKNSGKAETDQRAGILLSMISDLWPEAAM